MAFRFGLDPVLKHRKRLEEIAQREFAEAQIAVDEILRRLEIMYERLDQVRIEIAQAEQQGSSRQLELVRTMENFITGQKVRIESVRLEARRLLEAAEDKQEALIVAAQEKKVLFKLKEKRLTEYREWLKKIEAKTLDDQTMMRQAWGKNR